MHYLYILRCADGTLYTGITNDVVRRVNEHNTSNRGAMYTHRRRPVRLVYTKTFGNHAAAARSEHRVKLLSRKEKQQLVSTRRNKNL